MKIKNISNTTIDAAKEYAEHTFVDEIYLNYMREDYPESFLRSVCKWYCDNKAMPYEFKLCVLAALIARGIIFDWGYQLPTNNEVRLWLPIVYKATKNKLPLKVVEAERTSKPWYKIRLLFDGRYRWCQAPKNGDEYLIPTDVYGVYDKYLELHQKWCDSHRYEHCSWEKQCEQCFVLNGKEVD